MEALREDISERELIELTMCVGALTLASAFENTNDPLGGLAVIDGMTAEEILEYCRK